MRRWIVMGAALAAVAVGAGAFGAHGLRAAVTPRMLEVWHTAVLYQMFHALGLFVVAFAAPQLRHRATDLAGWLFVTGIALFSGSLYVLVLSGVTWLGAVTPVGGLAFIAGWGALVFAAVRSPELS